jgi:hypothetical protein
MKRSIVYSARGLSATIRSTILASFGAGGGCGGDSLLSFSRCNNALVWLDQHRGRVTWSDAR